MEAPKHWSKKRAVYQPVTLYIYRLGKPAEKAFLLGSMFFVDPMEIIEQSKEKSGNGRIPFGISRTAGKF